LYPLQTGGEEEEVEQRLLNLPPHPEVLGGGVGLPPPPRLALGWGPTEEQKSLLRLSLISLVLF